MTSPSELLVAAADRVRDLAAAAPNDGPWTAERMFWKLGSKYMPDKWWWDIRDDEGTVALIPEEDDEVEPVSTEDARGRAEWIVALSPAVAPALEAFLRCAAVEESNPSSLEYGSASLNALMITAHELARRLCPELVEEDQK